MSLTFNQRIAFTAGILLTFFLVLFGSVSYFKTASYLQKEITAKQMSRMQSLKIDINAWMEPSMRMVQDLSKELELFAPFNKEEVVPLLVRSKKAINAVQVYFGLEDGRMMYDTGKELRRDWYDPRTRPWYSSGISADQPLIADPFVGFASNQFTIAIASPVMVNGKKQGVVAASFYVNKLYRKIKAIHAEDGYAYVVDASGKILLHPDKEMLNLSLPEQTAEFKKMYDYMVKHKEGAYEDHHELMTFGELHNGWYIVVSVSKEDVYAFSNTMLKLFIVMGTLMIALTVMILMKMTQKSLEES